MRIWSIPPKYLDRQGLLALWREALLAKAVLEGKTRGYLNHPQLARFKGSKEPLKAINTYLSFILAEGVKRKFKFNPERIDQSLVNTNLKISVTTGQLCYEYNLLINKLLKRDPAMAKALLNNKAIEPHPLFIVVPGELEKWEKLRER
ncbi:MAG: pyrimidine dimer DNA glycosylase/endonuclease V [Candidatus Bathyarchaeia archaeon]